MANFILYEVDTGRIVANGSTPDEYVGVQAGEGQRHIVVPSSVDADKNYVLGGGVIEREEFPVTVSGATLSGIPVGTVVDINHMSIPKLWSSETVMDGVIDLEGSDPGTYKVTLTLFPYIGQTFEIVIA
jgi:hypothetical protein